MGPSYFFQNDLQFFFPDVLFVVISNPQHPNYSTRCFNHILAWASIHHVIQLNSKSNPEFDIIRFIFGMPFMISRDLVISYRETWLDKNQILMKANGGYLFNGSYQIEQSLFLPKRTLTDAKSEV